MTTMFYTNHLPSHGASPLYQWGFGKRWGKGIKVTYGGYQLRGVVINGVTYFPNIPVYFQRYRRHVVHFAVGKLIFSIVWK